VHEDVPPDWEKTPVDPHGEAADAAGAPSSDAARAAVANDAAAYGLTDQFTAMRNRPLGLAT
jgi:hypothetical protein